MNDIILKLTRPVKVAKDTCVACGTKQWKCFNSIHSTRSTNKGIAKLLQLYCHINVVRGGMCNTCERALLKMNHKIEQFRDSCHETLVKNRGVTRENLVRTGIQTKDECPKNNVIWPGKENLFVALSVCSNLPSALHHTITTENLSPRKDVKVATDDTPMRQNDCGKDCPRICIKAECYAKPALVPLTNENQKTALPLARLAAMKIGSMMGTGSLGSARLCRQASPIKKVENIKPGETKEAEVTNTNGADNNGSYSSKTDEKVDDDIRKTNLRCTSVQQILNEADWLYRNDSEEVCNKKQELDEDTTRCSKKNNSHLDHSAQSDQPKPKRLKSNNVAATSTKDIIYWESNWRKNNESVYFTCPFKNCPEMLLGCERRMHGTAHRVNVDGYCCPQCDFKHDKWATMREHLRCSHGMPSQLFNCDQDDCNEIFDSFKRLRQHMLYVHSFESALQTDKNARKMFDRKLLEEDPALDVLLSNDLCSVCGMACKLDDLITHETKHNVPGCALLQCVACNLLFASDQIKKHVLAMHRKLTYLYQCETCEFSSETSAGLQRHMGIKHADEILLVCDKCGKGFKTAAALNVHHKRIHVTDDQKTVLCSTCGYLCAHETLLKEHVRKVHKKPSWRRFKCPLCEHFSLRESSLERHMQMYHSDSEERQFKCSYCPYASKTKANLLRHQQTHRQYSPFQCPHCNFTGAKKRIIEDHIVAKHTKEMPYTCALCGSAFSCHNTLVSHMAHHQASNNEQITERIVTDEQHDRFYFQL